MTCSLRVLQAGTARPFDLEYSIFGSTQGSHPSLRPNGHASVARDTARMAPQLVFLQLRPTVDSRATQPSVQPSVVKPLDAPHEWQTQAPPEGRTHELTPNNCRLKLHPMVGRLRQKRPPVKVLAGTEC